MRAAWLALILVLSGAASAAEPMRATKVRVDKSDRRLYVYNGERMVASYRVALGINPVGHKQQEGDRKTPEGRYVLDYKNPSSLYYRSIHISYPNATDKAAARKRGVAPGGAIMIHGQPNDPVVRRRVRLYPWPDWTDGCIALSDQDMDALWKMVRVPTPIEITP
ncbi:L,D-transpeptidase family protein [Lysobacter terrae]